MLMLCYGAANAQEEQLIIRIPKQTEWKIYTISRQLKCLDGVHFSGYVNDASCILLRYDASTIKDISIITTTLHHLNKKLKYEIVKGITAFDVIDGKLPLKKL